jgi:hypothetical protein
MLTIRKSHLVKTDRMKREVFFSLAASAILIIGIIKQNSNLASNRDGLVVDSLWNGFGYEVLFTMLLLWLVGIIYINYKKGFKSLTFLKFPFFILLIGIYALSLWQSKNSIIDFDHSEYILNESLALSSGNYPYSNFIPQYSILYNLITAPIANFVTATRQIELILLSMFIITILTIFLSIKIVNTSLKSNNHLVSFMLVVPLTLLTPGLGREWILGSISSSLSAIPNRMFPAILLFTLYFYVVLNMNNNKFLKIKMILVGILAGNILWQSQDFGLAAIISLFLTILFTNIYSLKIKVLQLKNFVLGLTFGLSFYPIFLIASGKPLHLDYVAFFTRQFGSGFGSEPISSTGPVLLIFPIIFIVMYFHFKINMFYKDKRLDLLKNSFIGSYFSFFILLTFPYFINRSITSGQLQIFLLPMSITLGALFGTFLRIGFFQTVSSFIVSKRFPNLMVHLPLLIILSLPFSALSLFPNPLIEIPRVLEKEQNLAWPPKKLNITLNNIDKALLFSEEEKVSVAYFGSLSNYIALEKQINVVNIFNSPLDFLISPHAYEKGCSSLLSNAPRFLILDYAASETFKTFMDINKKSNFCGSFEFSSKLQIEPYFFAEKMK